MVLHEQWQTQAAPIIAKLNELITPTTGNYAAGWAKRNRTWAGPGGVALQHTGSNTMWYVNLWIAPALDRAFLAGANAKNADSFAMSDDVIWSMINHDGPDAGGEAPSFTLISGSGSTHNHLFTLDANGTLKTATALDHEGNATLGIRVRATDERNASLEKVFTVAVTPVNNPPTDILLGPASIAENQIVETKVGRFMLVDPDRGIPITFSGGSVA